MTSYAASGNISYGNYGMTYSTTSTKITINVKNTGNADYRIMGNVAYKRVDGSGSVKIASVGGGNGFGRTSSFVATGEVSSKYKLVKSTSNKSALQRSNSKFINDCNTLITFSYAV